MTALRFVRRSFARRYASLTDEGKSLLIQRLGQWPLSKRVVEDFSDRVKRDPLLPAALVDATRNMPFTADGDCVGIPSDRSLVEAAEHLRGKSGPVLPAVLLAAAAAPIKADVAGLSRPQQLSELEHAHAGSLLYGTVTKFAPKRDAYDLAEALFLRHATTADGRTPPRVLLSWGDALATSGNPRRAIPFLKAAIDGDPSLWEAHLRLATCHGDIGEQSLAIGFATSAFHAAPPSMQPFVGGTKAAFLLHAVGSLLEARTLFENAIAAFPDVADFWNGLGLAMRMSHDPLKARELYEKALQVDPKHIAARVNLAVLGVIDLDDIELAKVGCCYFSSDSEVPRLSAPSPQAQADAVKLLDDSDRPLATILKLISIAESPGGKEKIAAAQARARRRIAPEEPSYDLPQAQNEAK